MLPNTISELLVLAAVGPWQPGLAAVQLPVTSRDLTFQLTAAGYPIAHATVRSALAKLKGEGLVAMLPDTGPPVFFKGRPPQRWACTKAGDDRVAAWRDELAGILCTKASVVEAAVSTEASQGEEEE